MCSSLASTIMTFATKRRERRIQRSTSVAMDEQLITVVNLPIVILCRAGRSRNAAAIEFGQGALFAQLCRIHLVFPAMRC